MRSVNKPDFTLKDFYENFVSKMSNKSKNHPDRKGKYLAIESDLLGAEKEYKNKAKTNTLLEIKTGHPQFYNIADDLTNKDFIDLYDKFRASKNTRKYYEKILKLADNKCVYCEKASGNEHVDHILPKSKYDMYTVTPYNLIPSCSKCNEKKTGKVGKYYHPAFVTFNKYDIVSCELSIKEVYGRVSLIPSYKINRPQELKDEKLWKQIHQTYEDLDLKKRYEDLATEIINPKIKSWVNCLKQGKQVFINRIEEEKDSSESEFSKNSANISLYNALLIKISEDDVFCEEFKKIYIKPKIE